MKNKDNLGNGMQKGERRQKLHKNQDNVGNPRKPSYFENHDGNSIK